MLNSKQFVFQARETQICTASAMGRQVREAREELPDSNGGITEGERGLEQLRDRDRMGEQRSHLKQDVVARIKHLSTCITLVTPRAFIMGVFSSVCAYPAVRFDIEYNHVTPMTPCYGFTRLHPTLPCSPLVSTNDIIMSSSTTTLPQARK